MASWRGFGFEAAIAMAAVALIVMAISVWAQYARFSHGGGWSAIALLAALIGAAVLCGAVYGALEHKRARDGDAIHAARATAVWYALTIPIAILLVVVAFREYPLPYPDPARVISGDVATFSIKRASSREVDLRLGLTGQRQSYRFVCMEYRSSGWCAAYPALLTLFDRPAPRKVELLATNGDIVMLRADGSSVVDWAAEKAHRLNIALWMFLLGGLGSVMGIWGTFAYANWAWRLARISPN